MDEGKHLSIKTEKSLNLLQKQTWKADENTARFNSLDVSYTTQLIKTNKITQNGIIFTISKEI